MRATAFGSLFLVIVAVLAAGCCCRECRCRAAATPAAAAPADDDVPPQQIIIDWRQLEPQPPLQMRPPGGIWIRPPVIVDPPPLLLNPDDLPPKIHDLLRQLGQSPTPPADD